MQKRLVKIVNRLGIHARAAAKLVTLSSRFASEIAIVVNGRRANARHFIAILLLSASVGSQIAIEVNGPDEMEAIVAVTRLINTGFGEN